MTTDHPARQFFDAVAWNGGEPKPTDVDDLVTELVSEFRDGPEATAVRTHVIKTVKAVMAARNAGENHRAREIGREGADRLQRMCDPAPDAVSEARSMQSVIDSVPRGF
jgi:hypothetical protein